MPRHCWASCSCPCLWSISMLREAAHLHWRWTLGWEAAGSSAKVKIRTSEPTCSCWNCTAWSCCGGFNWACIECRQKKGSWESPVMGANLSLVREPITFTSFTKDILTAPLEDGELSTKGQCPLGSQEEHMFPLDGRVAVAAQICLEPFPNYQNQVVWKVHLDTQPKTFCT